LSPDEQDLVDVAGEPVEIARIIDVALLEDDPGTAQREGHVYAPWLYDGVTKIASDLTAITATVSQIA
jgi:hypothetical protein